MLLTIRDVLSCTWLLPMGFQESSRYGCGRWGSLIAQILASRTGYDLLVIDVCLGGLGGP